MPRRSFVGELPSYDVFDELEIGENLAPGNFPAESTSIGEGAMGSSLDGALRNIGIGYDALNSLTTGDDNVAIGKNAAKSVVTASENVALGSGAMENATGGGNTVLGYNALNKPTTTVTNNTVAGALALQGGAGGNTVTGNVALGGQALGGDIGVTAFSGSYNVAVGNDAGSVVSDVTGSVMFGTNAGSDANLDGSTYLLGLGYNTLSSSAAVNSTICVGNNADMASNNSIVIGRGSGADFSSGENYNVAIGILSTGTGSQTNTFILGESPTADLSPPDGELNLADTIRGDMDSGTLFFSSTTSVQNCTGTLNVRGSIAYKVSTVNSGTIASTDHFVAVDTSSSPRTVALPLAADRYNSTDGVAGEVEIMDIAANSLANNITVNRSGSDTIVTTTTGNTSVTINKNGAAMRFVAIDASTWKVIWSTSQATAGGGGGA